MADNLNSLVVTPGSKREHFRKGQKGQGAHAHTKKRGFEGGQMPLGRRLPKYGFKNLARIEKAVVNVGDLESFKDGSIVDAKALIENGLVKSDINGIKILGSGKLTKKLTVKANAFSASAKKAIEAVGGTVEEVK